MTYIQSSVQHRAAKVQHATIVTKNSFLIENFTFTLFTLMLV